MIVKFYCALTAILSLLLLNVLPAQAPTPSLHRLVPETAYIRQSTGLSGLASWYGHPFHGRLTANGERYNMYDLTAAHKTLPLGTLLEVKNIANGKSIIVRVNDRGPYIRGRSLDLSFGAAQKLGFVDKGLVHFEAKVLKKTTVQVAQILPNE